MEQGNSRQLGHIALEEIDLQDRSCCVGDGRVPEALLQSIAVDGLLNPPAVCRTTAAGGFRIVCGYRRVEALAALGRRDAPAWILPSGASAADLLGCALRDNLAHRTFNILEQSAAVVLLRSCLSDEDIIDIWLPRLGLRPSPASLVQAEALHGLEPEIRDGLLQGCIFERTALRLARMAAADRRALWGVLMRVHLSASKQTEMIENCQDIVRRDGCSIADIVHTVEVGSMLASDRHSAAQRGEIVRRHIRRRRFPRLVRREERFTAARARLALPGHMALHPPDGFEGDTYRIDIAFSRPEQLREAAGHLEALAGHATLTDMLGEEG
jgi:hypothetical protein